MRPNVPNAIEVNDASEFFFEPGVQWTSLGEVRLKNKNGGPVGNIDYVLVSYDDRGRVLDFASLEIQAVYISGNLGGAFKSYMDNPKPDFNWIGALYYPSPDYLSSSKKRLVPQLISKGGVMKLWGKKQGVAIQTAFFDTLPLLHEVPPSKADLAWFLYDLVFDASSQAMQLTLNRVVFTEYESSLLALSNYEPGELDDFVALLQQKLDNKLAGRTTTEAPLYPLYGSGFSRKAIKSVH